MKDQLLTVQLWKGSIHVAGFYLYSSIPIDIVIYRVQLTKPELLYKVVAAFRVGVKQVCLIVYPTCLYT